MAKTGLRAVVEAEPVAESTLFISGLEDAHFVGEVPILKGQHTADPGGEVGGIRLKAPLGQGAVKAHSGNQSLVNGVGLVAVGDDQAASEPADGSVNDKPGVFYFACVKGLGVDNAVPLGKDPVAAVGAAAHDEIGSDSVLAVGALSDDDSPAGVGIPLQAVTHGFHFVNIHLASSEE